MRIGLRVGPQILLNVAIESDAHRCLEARQAIAGQWLSDHEIGRHELFEIQLHGVHCRNAGIAPKRKEADVVPSCVQNRRHVAPPEGSASKQLATQTHIARDVVHLHSTSSPSKLDGAILRLNGDVKFLGGVAADQCAARQRELFATIAAGSPHQFKTPTGRRCGTPAVAHLVDECVQSCFLPQLAEEQDDNEDERGIACQQRFDCNVAGHTGNWWQRGEAMFELKRALSKKT